MKEEMRLSLNYGSKLEDNLKFCTNCGAKLSMPLQSRCTKSTEPQVAEPYYAPQPPIPSSSYYPVIIYIIHHPALPHYSILIEIQSSQVIVK